MNGAFYIGAAGLEAQQRALDVVANNIANINTTAFKRSEARFADLVSAADGNDLKPAGPAFAGLSGVMMSASPRVYTQGDLRQTGKTTDIAISGEGFIELMGPEGQSMLWRGGALKINADGYLAAENGMPLKAMISAPLSVSGFHIDGDGRVTAQVDGETTTSLGQIDLVLAKDANTLSAMGDGLYQAAFDGDLLTVAPGKEGGGVLVQGAVEGSNVQLADEMVNLLMLQRAYGASAQVLQAGDQLMAIVNGLRR